MKYTKEQIIEMLEKAIEQEAQQWEGKEKCNVRYYGIFIRKNIEKMMK